MLNKLILKWYDINKRTLPWRDINNPYFTWVSEIMLQQTQVNTVIPFFNRFITELPTVHDLALCDEDRLLKLWEGLGYYSRVRNMQVAAKMIVEDYEGIIPTNKAELTKLKGIGEYTAGAISSIAFDNRDFAIDGNVLRVFSRLYKLPYDVKNRVLKKEVELLLNIEMPKKRVGDFNQAIMDIGATICMANGTPKCDVCPLKKVCLSYKDKCTTDYPHKLIKKKKKEENVQVNLLIYKDTVAITKRPSKGLLASTYQFVNGNLDIESTNIQQLKKSIHQFTHINWTIETTVYIIDKPLKDYEFVNIKEVLNLLMIPVAYKTALDYLKSISR